MNKNGSLVCVGPGMILGAHMTERCKNHIQQADVVFTSCHPVIEKWLATFNPRTHSLQYLYADNKDRRNTYRQMQEVMLEEVRNNQKVVGVFYGHPGVFAQVPHRAIQQAIEEGYQAWMEPGISADACLYADMGIDPGAYGCQQFEASQFMFYQRQLDPSAYVILWQLGHAGDLSLTPRLTGAPERQVLVDMLFKYYAPSHEVAIYESPFLPTQQPRIIWQPLDELPEADISLISTLVIPPGRRLIPNDEIVTRLKSIYPPSHDKNTAKAEG
ncbi:MAG: hypothetical protein GY897_11595 [Alteromonas sp.]|nr:hypothetical protein [Alteromonas sp.]